MTAENKKVKQSAKNQYIAAIICSYLNLVYGLSIGWPSTAVSQLEKGGVDLPSGVEGIASLVSGWIGGSFCLGALISSPLHGMIADSIGRKYAAYIVSVCYMIQWILIMFAKNMFYVFLGRSFGGVAGAGSITVALIYNNEVSEDCRRGILGGFMSLFYAMGIFISYILAHYFSYENVIYINLGMSVIFPLIWWSMPESPKYLILRAQDERALKVIKWLRNCSSDEALKILAELRFQQAGAVKPATICDFFKSEVARRAFVLTILMATIQTFTGVFAVSSYANNVFQRAGKTLDPFIATIIYGITMCIGAIIPQLLTERIGRKILLSLSCIFISIGMFISGSYFLAISSGYINEETEYVIFIPIVTLSGCVLCYYMGLGSVMYVTIAEMYSDDKRGLAGSFLSIMIWFTCFILIQYFSYVVELVGDHSVFYFFSVVAFLGAIFVYKCIPETKGKTFQDISVDIMKKK